MEWGNNHWKNIHQNQILAKKNKQTSLLGKPVKAQMFRLGEKDPVVQLIQGSPLQFKVLPGEEFLLSVGQTTHVRLEHTPVVTIVQHGDAKLSDDGHHVLFSWGSVLLEKVDKKPSKALHHAYLQPGDGH